MLREWFFCKLAGLKKLLWAFSRSCFWFYRCFSRRSELWRFWLVVASCGYVFSYEQTHTLTLKTYVQTRAQPFLGVFECFVAFDTLTFFWSGH
jgi:hypothetical protein